LLFCYTLAFDKGGVKCKVQFRVRCLPCSKLVRMDCLCKWICRTNGWWVEQRCCD